MRHFWTGFDKQARELTARTRKNIPTGQFALEGSRRYPIHDRIHARNALARVAQHGTPAEKEEVTRKVHQKYPDIGE